MYLEIVLLVFQPLFYFKVWLFSYSNIIVFSIYFLLVIKCKKIYVAGFEKGYFLFLFLGIVSLMWSKTWNGMIRILDTMTYFFIVSSIRQFCTRDQKEQRCETAEKLMRCYIISVCVVVVLCYFEDSSSLTSWARLGKTLYENAGLNQIVFSIYLIVALYFSIYFCLIRTGRTRNIFLVVSVFLYISAILTGIRKMIVLPLILILLYVMQKYKKNALKLVGAIILVVFLSVIAVYMIMHFSSSTAGRINQLLDLLKGVSSKEGSYVERMHLKKLAQQCFLENPIFGVGIGCFRDYSVTHGGPDLYAHNNYLEVLANLGLVGFFIYYINLLFLVKRFKGNEGSVYFSVAFILTMLFSDIYQVSYYYDSFAIAFGIVSTIGVQWNTIN